MIADSGVIGQDGAADAEKDRFVTRFGPSELSHLVREARLDITPVLSDPVFGPDVGHRMRLIEENGFLLKKLETYDVRYRDVSDPMNGRFRRAVMDSVSRSRAWL